MMNPFLAHSWVHPAQRWDSRNPRSVKCHYYERKKFIIGQDDAMYATGYLFA